jgi:hypothetical protein
MKNTNLTRQEFVIFKEREQDLKIIKVNFDKNYQDNEMYVEIIDEKNVIKLWNADAKALKKIFEDTNYIFNQ